TMIGSISETGLLLKLIGDAGLKNHAVSEVMEKPFPVVPAETTIEKLSGMISKEVPAVVTHDSLNNLHIVTKSDIIRVLSK
ncbi:MAG: CBS domain-containing protein, partial [Chitinophagales bacterium]|nr:CBS domain-containing protein [Chitinophagales bacterium]